MPHFLPLTAACWVVNLVRTRPYSSTGTGGGRLRASRMGRMRAYLILGQNTKGLAMGLVGMVITCCYCGAELHGILTMDVIVRVAQLLDHNG